MSYFPFWSLFRVLYGFLFLVFFFLCRSCLVLEQTCIYFQCKFCKWKKTKIKKITPGATNLLYLWEIKSSFLMAVPSDCIFP